MVVFSLMKIIVSKFPELLLLSCFSNLSKSENNENSLLIFQNDENVWKGAFSTIVTSKKSGKALPENLQQIGIFPSYLAIVCISDIARKKLPKFPAGNPKWSFWLYLSVNLEIPNLISWFAFTLPTYFTNPRRTGEVAKMKNSSSGNMFQSCHLRTL